MKGELLLCVLFMVPYKCDSYGPKSPGILGTLITGAQEVGSNVQGILEGIAGGGVNLQGHVYANQPGGYGRPQVPNNYAGYKPKEPVETIVVIVEETQEQTGHRHPGQYGPGYGYRPPTNYYNNPGYIPGYNGYGGYGNNGPWNQGHGHRPHHHHHRPGYGYNPHGHYNNNGNYYGNNGNQIPNQPFDRPNNNGGNPNQNTNGNMPVDQPNRPFDRPVNTDIGNIPTNPPNGPFDRPVNTNLDNIPTNPPNGPFDRPVNTNLDNIPINPPNKPFDRPVNTNLDNIPTNLPNRPFDRPVNTDIGNIPTNPPNRPFDRPINNGDQQNIPTNLPNQSELENSNKPLDVITQRPEQITIPNTENKKPVSTTENNMTNVDKTTKKPDDDFPLFVPLNPNQYVYGGDKIEINAPKRETSDKPNAAEDDDYSNSNIDPLDIRFGSKDKQ